MAATAPTTPPTMAATFAVPVPLPDEAAAPTVGSAKAGAVDAVVLEAAAPAPTVLEDAAAEPNPVEVGAEVLVAKMLDDEVSGRGEDEAIPDSETCVELLLVEVVKPASDETLVKVESTGIVVDVVEVTDMTEVLVWTLGRALATIGANS
jgi:hypothetical protein